MATLKVIQDFAKETVGGLSFVSKMPGASWSISAHKCKTGGKLAKMDGTVCSNCYALKGHYNRQVVRDAHARRLEASRRPDWSKDMAAVINSWCARTGEYHFRWFDSGDLQDWPMLLSIIHVCELTPDVRHWLPTKEYALIRKLARARDVGALLIPSNLCIRVSAPRIGERIDNFLGFGASMVTADSVPEGVNSCPAPEQGGECRDCRTCWDLAAGPVAYHEH